jgi:predicted DCC family thiol-disulfide oxidoreductase YuxK
MTGIYFLIILAFTPCGDAFSLDSLYRTKPARDGSAYAYPILLMQLVLSWCYFTAGLSKLRISGLAYFSRDNLPIQAIEHSLDNLHDTQFRLAFYLPQFREFMGIAMAFAILWEILFPIAVFSRRAKPWILGFGLVFHLAIMLTMNVYFFNLMAMYLVFVDWPAVVRWFSRQPLFRRVSSWWADFRRTPEEFPDVRIPVAATGETLLWDGDCMFCASMVNLFRRFARRPFRDRTFMDMEEHLPHEVRQWSNRQMFWVFADGRVVGGSRALIEVLEAMGYSLLAAVLESPPFRPFTWIGYRLVASNRDVISARLGPSCATNS